MKRTTLYILVAIVVIGLLLPGTALAAKKKKKSKAGKGSSPPAASARKTRFADVAVDFGLPAFGVLQLGKITAGDTETDFSGSGTVSFPYMGVHAALYPAKDWYIQFGLGYLHHSGTGEFSSDDIKTLDGDEFDWGLNAFRLDAGIGKIFGTFSRVRPKAGAGLGIWYLSWYTEEYDKDETFSGWTVAPYGLVGVDADVVRGRASDIFVGINLRTDLIYTLSPFEFSGKGDADAKFFYMPWSIYLNAGLRF